MKERIKNLLEKIILKKYPKIISIEEIKDISEEIPNSYFPNIFHVSFVTSECLESEEMVEIDQEVKTLFSMLAFKTDNPFVVEKSKISTFYDCEDGEGFIFKAPYGYRN